VALHGRSQCWLGSVAQTPSSLLTLPSPTSPTTSRSELKEEQGFHFVQVQDARALLDRAADLLMDVVSREEERMRGSVPGYKDHPYTAALWRCVLLMSSFACRDLMFEAHAPSKFLLPSSLSLSSSSPPANPHPYDPCTRRQACEYLYAQSLVEAAAGKHRDQLLRLGEIDSAQVRHVPVGRPGHCLVPRPFHGRAGLRAMPRTTRARVLLTGLLSPFALPPSHFCLQASYHCASDELLARKLREQAAALISKGKAATNTEDRDVSGSTLLIADLGAVPCVSHAHPSTLISSSPYPPLPTMICFLQSDLHKALETLKELQESYEALHPEGGAKLAVSQADILQAQGEVYAALQQPNRAKTYFGDAKKIFAAHLGPDHQRVKELEAKMQSTRGTSAAAAFRLSLDP
jgi:hypothetical protein